VLPAPHEAVASAAARTAAVSAIEYVLGRCIVTSVAQPAAFPAIAPAGDDRPARAKAGGTSGDRRCQL
jgi:hypothetical protein